MQKIHQIRSALQEQHPLIHCITNPISINQCANAVLAIGARPMMAEHPREVREITQTAGALLLNLGNITDVRMESMVISAKTAAEGGIPFVLDAVGVACSELRRDFTGKLLETAIPAVLKGNYSEIQALYRGSYRSSGVDADETLTTEAVAKAAIELARKYGCVILASGKTDIITDGRRIVYVKNGTTALSCVTGTGCMLGVLCASYLAAGEAMEASITACLVLGICGELAETAKGTGSFLVNLMDGLSILQPLDLEKYANWEERTIEEL